MWDGTVWDGMGWGQDGMGSDGVGWGWDGDWGWVEWGRWGRWGGVRWGDLLDSCRRHVDMTESLVKRHIALQPSIVGEANEEHVDKYVVEARRPRDAEYRTRGGVACRRRRERQPLTHVITQLPQFPLLLQTAICMLQPDALVQLLLHPVDGWSRLHYLTTPLARASFLLMWLELGEAAAAALATTSTTTATTAFSATASIPTTAAYQRLTQCLPVAQRYEYLLRTACAILLIAHSTKEVPCASPHTCAPLQV